MRAPLLSSLAIVSALLAGARFPSLPLERPVSPPRCGGLPEVDAPRARANDNRTPAASWRGDTLVLSLVARPVAWFPEADDGCALPVLAFAEEGRDPSVPGPLVRVASGTPLRVSVRNAAGRTLWLRGFNDHPSAVRTGIGLPADSGREFRFTASTPGTYAYGATLEPFPAGGVTVRPAREDGQLVGAFVVDSAGAPASPRDRVLVVTRYTVRNPVDSLRPALYFATMVNGKSWPYTERLSYAEGDSVRWRVINGSLAAHPMHLHGFYFRVVAKGTVSGDTALAVPRVGVTEPMLVGQTMEMHWRAERPGNWLFHCHLLAHMSARQRMDRLSDTALAEMGGAPAVARREAMAAGSPMGAAHHANHATEGMAGLIVGVYVTPATRTARAPRPEPPRRTLRLFANQRADVFGAGVPGYGFVLQEGARAPAPDSIRRPGTPIILRRGEPVRIVVTNRLTTPIAVHWHGLELESFFDGVGDWSGGAGHVAPPIAPGDTFVVRLTPPRAGTFMYHVHGEEGQELASGLYGALVVVEGPPALDTLTDKIVLLSDRAPRPAVGSAVNGSTSPSLQLLAGTPTRLRLIGITANATSEVTLLAGPDTLRWRQLARDGAALTGEPLTAARRVVGPGMIGDYELTVPEPGELTLRVIRRGVEARIVDSLRVPITVVAPAAASIRPVVAGARP